MKIDLEDYQVVLQFPDGEESVITEKIQAWYVKEILAYLEERICYEEENPMLYQAVLEQLKDLTS